MSSLRSYSNDPGRIVSEARLIFSRAGRYTIIVEGESDYRLLSQWVVAEQAAIKKVDGKDRVKDAWIGAAGRFNGLVCIVDVDYEPVIGEHLVDSERFIYVSGGCESGCMAIDGIDLEATLIRSSAFAKVVINKYREDDLYDDSLGERIRDLRERLRIAARDLGAVRAANMAVYKRERRSPIGWRLAVADDFFDAIFDAREVRLNFEELGKALLRSVGAGRGAMEALLDDASRLRGTYADGWDLCRGHDMSEMLAKHFTSLLPRFVSAREIEENLRMSCELELLRNTQFGMRLSRLRDVTGKEFFGHTHS